MEKKIVYKLYDKIYINLTNKCSNNCDFCVRNNKDFFHDYDLWLDKEPTAEEVMEKLSDYMEYSNFVFCGFGEPLFKLDEIIKIGSYLKSKGKKVRINTNGQASLICKRDDVAKKLKGIVDTVSISLNATDAKKYQAICHSAYGEKGYQAMLKFASDCRKEGIRVILSVVDIIGKEEIQKAKEIADSLGVELRVRKYV